MEEGRRGGGLKVWRERMGHDGGKTCLSAGHLHTHFCGSFHMMWSGRECTTQDHDRERRQGQKGIDGFLDGFLNGFFEWFLAFFNPFSPPTFLDSLYHDCGKEID